MIDLFLYIGYGLIGVATLSAIILPLVAAVGDPKSLAKSGMGVGALIVVFFIGYAMSGDEVTTVYSQFGVDAGMSKWIGGAVTMMYLMIFIVTVSIIYSEVSKFFK